MLLGKIIKCSDKNYQKISVKGIAFDSRKVKKKDIFFNKLELQIILNLYAKMVSGGEWKDYGLSISKKEVSFNVYHRTPPKFCR